MKGFFVTGTDTDVGKTWVTAGLLTCLNQAGLKTAAMKPVASGCSRRDGQWQNDDARLLMQFMSSESAYEDVNPYAFEPAIAPHLAAAMSGTEISLPVIMQRLEKLAAAAQMVVVEGVGGWLVPLNADQSVADLAKEMGLPVILVVSIRLGCLNHALLTAQSVRALGLPLIGWVANICDAGFTLVNENIDSLQKRLPAPLLATIPYMHQFSADEVASHFDSHFLLSNFDQDQ